MKVLCSLILAVVNVIRLALKKQYLVSYPDPLQHCKRGDLGTRLSSTVKRCMGLTNEEFTASVHTGM